MVAFAVGEQAQRVGHDDECGAFVERDRWADAQEADEGGRDQKGHHSKADVQVLANDG